MESSSGVNPPSIIRNNPTRLIMLDRKMSSGLSSVPGTGKSNGFTWFSEVKDILKKSPPTPSTKNSYSFSGSITITSTPHIRYLNISSFMAYDFPDPDLAKTTMLEFSKVKRSNNTKELLWPLMPYKIPSLELKSNDVNGKVVESGSVFIGMWTESKSI